MCGRYALSRSADQLAAAFAVRRTVGEGIAPDYNVTPTKAVPVVLARRSGGGPVRELRAMRWGLVPPWAARPSSAAHINARLETAAERPAFAPSLAAQRCLVPADGWYEWAPSPGGRSRRPWFVSSHDGELLALAGLYARWRDPGAVGSGWLWSMAVLTTEAEPGLAHIHDRMPVVVAPDRHSAWLDPDLRDPLRALDLVAAPAAGRFASHPVSPAVGDVRAAGRRLIEPVGDQSPEAVGDTLF